MVRIYIAWIALSKCSFGVGEGKSDLALISCHSCISTFGANLRLLIHAKPCSWCWSKLTSVNKGNLTSKFGKLKIYCDYCIWHSNINRITMFLLTSRKVAAMFLRYQLSMLELLLVLFLVLVLVVNKTSQTISGGFVPSLNVTVNQWNGESLKLKFFRKIWSDFIICQMHQEAPFLLLPWLNVLLFVWW